MKVDGGCHCETSIRGRGRSRAGCDLPLRGLPDLSGQPYARWCRQAGDLQAACVRAEVYVKPPERNRAHKRSAPTAARALAAPAGWRLKPVGLQCWHGASTGPTDPQQPALVLAPRTWLQKSGDESRRQRKQPVFDAKGAVVRLIVRPRRRQAVTRAFSHRVRRAQRRQPAKGSSTRSVSELILKTLEYWITAFAGMTADRGARASHDAAITHCMRARALPIVEVLQRRSLRPMNRFLRRRMEPRWMPSASGKSSSSTVASAD